MLDSSEILDHLARRDPARYLPPMASVKREEIRDRILSDRSETPGAPASARSRWRWLTTRSVRIGSFTFAPAAVLGTLAVSAVAAAAVITTTATTLFQVNPQRGNAAVGTVVPSTVHEIGTVSISDYGEVEAWVASTKPGGFCFALKLPDGSWGGYPIPKSFPAANGWDGGSVPGCFQTQQQQTLKLGVPATGQALEYWSTVVQNTAGQAYVIYVGYVEAQGVAVSVRDSVTGITAPVTSDGYYVLAEKAPMAAAPAGVPAAKLVGGVAEDICVDCDDKDLQVLNAAGQRLEPDYRQGVLAPRNSAGPTSG